MSETISTKELYDVVCGATSQDPLLIQASTKRLKDMLEIPGGYDALHEIAAQRTVPLHVRQQSIIQFKNGALSHWRSRKLLSNEQRQSIRARTMIFLEEEDETIFECNKVIVAKIARYDYPTSWSSVVNDIMSILDTNLQARYNSSAIDQRSTLILRRSLSVLNEIIKEFMNMKMLTGVKTMGQLVIQLHGIFYGYYSKIASYLVSVLNPSTVSLPRMADDILIAHLVFKLLSKMASWFWHRSDQTGKVEFDGLKSWFSQLFQDSTTQLQTLFDLRINLVIALRDSPSTPDEAAARSIDYLTRHVRLFGKLFRRLQQLAVARFVALPNCDSLVLYYWSKVVQATSGPPELISDSNHAVFPVRLLVQAMALFKESLAQWTPFRKNGKANENVLSKGFVEDAVRLLVTRFIPLNPSDLETWMADPEEWVNAEDKENEQWEFELRPCSERVLMTLATQYTDYVVPLLGQTFEQIISQPTVDLPTIIQKEAVYCAIGRCASRLKDKIPFDQWLAHNLSQEVRDTNPNYPIIKRRIAWLIGKWLGDSCAPATNPLIWEILLHLLRDQGPGTDAVVRLTAAISLHECVDTLDFNVNIFEPFLAPITSELVRILDETDTLESKRRVIRSLNTIVEQVGKQIVPLVGVITGPLPKLWSDAGKDYLLKSSLLTTVTKLVESSGERSTLLHGIVVPLIRESLSPTVISFLDEDGLSLWQSTLRNATTVNGSPGLIELFPIIVMLLAENVDLLGRITSIHDSYFILDAPNTLRNFSVNLMQAFKTALSGQATAVNIKDMLVGLNMLIQLSPSSLWGEPMHVSGLFAHLLNTTIDDEKMAVTLIAEHIYIFARIAMSDRQMFLQLVSATANTQSKPESLFWEGLLDVWWQKFDNMSESRHRKLAAMGIASLVATGRPELLQRLPTDVFSMWTDIFIELKEARRPLEGHSSPITRFWDENEPPSNWFQGSEGTLEYDRRKLIWENDPVRTIQLSTYVQSSLREAESMCGSQAFRTGYLDKVDPVNLKTLQEALSQ